MRNRFLKLPFHFDTLKLKNDLSASYQFKWTDHFNQSDYSGKWKSISLRSASGLETDIYSHPDTKNFTNTPALEKCTYFQTIINSFECEKETIRLLSLSPDSSIKEHTDAHAGYEYGFFRIHIPITTNENVSFIVDSNEVPMKEGECWYANFHLPHSISNKGKTDRVHLIMDCKRNEWSDKLFGEIGYDFEYEKKIRDYDLETKQRIIEELLKMKTETANQLILKLQKEIEDRVAL